MHELIINFLKDNNIPYTDNGRNDNDVDQGRYTLYDGLIELFEPDEDCDIYVMCTSGDIDDLPDVISQLKEKDCTFELMLELYNLLPTFSVMTFFGEELQLDSKNLFSLAD